MMIVGVPICSVERSIRHNLLSATPDMPCCSFCSKHGLLRSGSDIVCWALLQRDFDHCYHSRPILKGVYLSLQLDLLRSLIHWFPDIDLQLPFHGSDMYLSTCRDISQQDA